MTLETGRVRPRVAPAPEPPGTPGILVQGRLQAVFVKVRPHHRCEDQFAVRGLIQKKIAQPLLPAGPDDQVRVRLAGRVQIVGKELFRNPIGGHVLADELPAGGQSLRDPNSSEPD